MKKTGPDIGISPVLNSSAQCRSDSEFVKYRLGVDHGEGRKREKRKISAELKFPPFEF
jgi:hypothetical protein